MILYNLNLLLKLYFCDLSRTTVQRQHSRHVATSDGIAETPAIFEYKRTDFNDTRLSAAGRKNQRQN